VINSDLENAAPTKTGRDAFWQEQTRWLEGDLDGAQRAAFRFVFAHHPPMTAVRRRQGDNPQMTALEPLSSRNTGFPPRSSATITTTSIT
jgi:hypothetical protein